MQLRLADSEVSSLEQAPTLYVSSRPGRPSRCCCSCGFNLPAAPATPAFLSAASCLAAVQVLVPRQSYLHSLVPQALRALQHLLPPGEDTPWFEHGRLPLKW